MSDVHICSFCNKTARDVNFMITGDKADICSECLIICNEIAEKNRVQGLVREVLAEQKPKRRRKSVPQSTQKGSK